MSGSAPPFMRDLSATSMLRNPSVNLACITDTSGSPGSAFNEESLSVRILNAHGSDVGGGPANVAPRESVKRRRGRPRKYRTDGTVASLSASKVSAQEATDTPAQSQKRGRGRPPGSGRKQRLALLGAGGKYKLNSQPSWESPGEWVESSAGIGFTPHVIIVPEGQDIVLKISQFSQQSHRAIFIMSASGSVSAATLQCREAPNHTATYQGPFDILFLSGSYLSSEESQAKTGSLSIFLTHSNGMAIGGPVCGPIIAGTPVQIIVGSFIYGGTRMKEKGKGKQAAGSEFVADSSRTSFSAVPPKNFAHSREGWSNLKHTEMRPGNIGINSTRG